MLAQAAFSISSVDLHAILPEILVTVALVAVLMVDLFLPDRAKSLNGVIAMTGVSAAGIALITLVTETPRKTFGNSFVVDNYAVLFKFLFIAVAAILILMSVTYLNEVVQNIQ